MALFRLGIIVSDKGELLLDYGNSPEFTSDQVYNILLAAFTQLKVGDQGLLIRVMLSSLEVLNNDPQYELAIKKVMELLRKDN